MSRVNKPNKYVNMPRHTNEELQTGKMVHTFGENASYRRVYTLRDWLYLKYNMSYKTYRNKSRSRREAMRDEYEEDTCEFRGRCRGESGYF